MIVHEQMDKLVTLAGLARRMAAMLGSGVTLGRSLEVSAREAGEGEFGHVLRAVLDRVLEGETLSEALGHHPAWFEGVPLALVRAGEIGGVLDETMHRWAELLDREIDLIDRCHLYELILLRGSAGGPGERPDRPGGLQEDTFEAVRPRLAASLFCYAFGVMLGSNVPIRLALKTAADALDAESAGRVCALAHDLPELFEAGEHLWEMLSGAPGLGGTVAELLRVGEEMGALDEMCLRASDLLRNEAERELRCAVALSLGG